MKVVRRREIKLNVVLFYICYAMLIFSAMLKRVFVVGDIVTNIYQICLIVLTIICIFSIFRMPRKRMIVFFAITGLVLVTRVVTGSNMLLALWLLIVAGRGIAFDKIVKFDLKIKIPLLILVSCLYFAGLTYVNLHYRDGYLRHSMGFSNPNVFSAYVMSIVAEILYLRRKKINWLDIIFSVVATLLINYFSDSRTQIICIAGLVAVLWGHNHLKFDFGKNSVFLKTLRFAKRHIFTILMLISIFLASIYPTLSSDVIQTTNTAMSGRLEAASNMMEKYDNFTLFGQKVQLVYSEQAKKTGQEVQNLDNVYVYFWLEFGIVTSLCMCYFMKKYMKKTEDDKNIIGYMMMIYLVGGLMEHFCLEPQLNIFLLYFIYMLYDPPAEQARQAVKSKVNGYIQPRTDEHAEAKVKGYVDGKSD